jgi:hypothetical protein
MKIFSTWRRRIISWQGWASRQGGCRDAPGSQGVLLFNGVGQPVGKVFTRQAPGQFPDRLTLAGLVGTNACRTAQGLP